MYASKESLSSQSPRSIVASSLSVGMTIVSLHNNAIRFTEYVVTECAAVKGSTGEVAVSEMSRNTGIATHTKM